MPRVVDIDRPGTARPGTAGALAGMCAAQRNEDAGEGADGPGKRVNIHSPWYNPAFGGANMPARRPRSRAVRAVGAGGA